MDSASKSLSYQPLTPRHIRLFGLEPGGPGDHVTGLLVEQHLDDLDREGHPFSALSYIWGDATNQLATITVGSLVAGQSGNLVITKTLWDVLQAFRSPSAIKWVWVDQICIDQSNDIEKGDQILLMRLIYQEAKWVVALLENYEGSDLAMNLLLDDEWSTIVPYSKALDAALQRLGQEPTTANRGEAFRAINALLEKKYWQRTWIWQEVTAKPDDCIIFYGNKQVRLRNLMVYIISYRQYMATSIMADKDWNTQPIWDMTPFFDFWAVRRLGREKSLLALLDEVRQSNVTDPRDKIFAVLPFSSDATQDIQPAYDKHAHEVYTKFALWQMVKYQSLDVITFSKGDLGLFPADNNSEKGRITTSVGEVHLDEDTGRIGKYDDAVLATWVPDWRARSPTFRSEKWKADRTVRPLPKSEHIYDPTLPRLFSASGSEPPDFRLTLPDTQTVINGLTVQAVKVAVIGRVQRERLPATVSLEVEEDWYREFQAADISNWDHSGDRLFKRTIYADIAFRAVKQITRHVRASSPDDELVWPNVTDVPDPTLQLGCLKHITNNRAPIRTTAGSKEATGLYGLGPAWTQRGDEIWILKGASVPFVLRPGTWTRQSGSINANLNTRSLEQVMYKVGDRILTFVGECFVLGLMDGEVLELMQLDQHHSRRSQVPELEREFHSITLF